MGENEQGGMLRTVIIIGLIALIAAAVIGGVVAAKASMQGTQTTALQSISKANNQKDIDFTLTGTNGKLDKVVSHTDLIKYGYFAHLRSGNEKNNDTGFNFPAYDNTTDLGMLSELYFNNQEIKYLFGNSDSDYLELSIDYTIKNAKSLTYDQASALNLDSSRNKGNGMTSNFSGLMIGLRSGTYIFKQNKVENLNGDMFGTLTLQVPKPTGEDVYEGYIILSNTNFDSVKLSNLRISNATHCLIMRLVL